MNDKFKARKPIQKKIVEPEHTAEQIHSESGTVNVTSITIGEDTNKFKIEHKSFISKILRQGGASHQDKEEIYRLYKLYIMPDHKGWTNSNCRTCASSIIKLFDDLKKFINENDNLFIN